MPLREGEMEAVGSRILIEMDSLLSDIKISAHSA